MHEDPDGAAHIADRLKLSGADRARLQTLAAPINAPPDAVAARRYIYSVGPVAARDRGWIGLARDGEAWHTLLT